MFGNEADDCSWHVRMWQHRHYGGGESYAVYYCRGVKWNKGEKGEEDGKETSMGFGEGIRREGGL